MFWARWRRLRRGVFFHGRLRSSAGSDTVAASKSDSRVHLFVLAVSLNDRPSIETCIEQASAMGLDGVDILERQMEKDLPEVLRSIKRCATINGVDLLFAPDAGVEI